MAIVSVSNSATSDCGQLPEAQWLEKKGFYQFSVRWLLQEDDLFRREKISLAKAFEIANSDPRITHFVYNRHGDIPWMVKDKSGNITEVGGVNLYHEGDAAFFSSWNFTIQPCDPKMADVSVYFRA
jgi:hypothetical protein